jgi:SH3-like domain-containing protein
MWPVVIFLALILLGMSQQQSAKTTILAGATRNNLVSPTTAVARSTTIDSAPGVTGSTVINIPAYRRSQGVIEVNLRQSPAQSAAYLGPVPDGATVEVVQNQGNWSYIKTTDGRAGWIFNEAIAP